MTWCARTVLALVALGSPVAAFAQQLGGGTNPEVSIVRMVGALIVCLLAALLAVLYLKLRSGKSFSPLLGRLIQAHPEIEVREVRRLTVQHSVSLIRHGGREYLVMLSPGDSLVLSDHPVADPIGGQGA